MASFKTDEINYQYILALIQTFVPASGELLAEMVDNGDLDSYRAENNPDLKPFRYKGMVRKGIVEMWETEIKRMLEE